MLIDCGVVSLMFTCSKGSVCCDVGEVHTSLARSAAWYIRLNMARNNVYVYRSEMEDFSDLMIRSSSDDVMALRVVGGQSRLE